MGCLFLGTEQGPGAAAHWPGQQRALSYLVEVTDNFVYLQGPANLVGDALSHLSAETGEDPQIEVNNFDLLHSPRHWDMNKLVAAKQQDQLNLEAARLLAQQKGLTLAKSPGDIMHQVRQPEITTRQMILLPPSYLKQAMLALHNATHAGAKATTQIART